jgi:transposase
MGKSRIMMAIQNEIFRLKALGRSRRETSQILGIDKETVGKYWNGPVAESPPGTPTWVAGLNWEHIKTEIENGTSKKILYEELREDHGLPAYSNFCRYFAIKIGTRVPEVTIKIQRIPGQSVEVDYSGDGWEIINPATNEVIQVELFVGAMSYSGHFYAEFTFSQKLEDFISSHSRMFSYFGGVCKYVIPDNCKTAVVKSEKYDPELNKTYHDMCVHYGIAIDPADPKSPRHKPNVERAVGILQQDFFPRIRNKTYTSLRDLNNDLWAYMRKKQDEIIRERGKSRKELFEQERPVLKELPKFPYEIFFFKKAKVHPDCHIQHSKNFYSVPYVHVGKDVMVRYNQSMVYVYINTECVAVHATSKGHGHYSTNDNHYPEKKIVDLHMNILGLKSEATSIGSNMELLIERIFKEAKFPLKNLRKAQGVIELAKKFEKEAIESAAESALLYNKLFYSYIKQCAENYRPPSDDVTFKTPIRQLELICLQGGI